MMLFRQLKTIVAFFLYFSLCCWVYPGDATIVVEYFAPFLSNGGYGTEGRAFARGLFQYTKHAGSAKKNKKATDEHEAVERLQMSCVQHGDAMDHDLWMGLSFSKKQELGKLMHRAGGHSITQALVKKDVMICHSEPGAWTPAKYSTTPCPGSYQGKARARVLIGRTMFETDRLPEGWVERINKMDYVWVPTEFQRDIFVKEGVHEHKVVVVPESVDTDTFSRENAQQLDPLTLVDVRQNLAVQLKYLVSEHGELHASTHVATEQDKKPFVFLSVFKWEERKNWKTLLSAFVREFTVSTQDSDVLQRAVLVLKVNGYHQDPDTLFQEATAFLEQAFSPESSANQDTVSLFPEILMITSVLAEDNLVRLYELADCVVMVTRGEGWGRPHVEAMAMDTPLISTFWSGPTAFMTPSNSYPVAPGELVEVESGAFKGHKWANPSISDVQTAMRTVLRDSNTGVAQEKAKAARKLMEQSYCIDCVAKIVMETLEQHVAEAKAKDQEVVEKMEL